MQIFMQHFIIELHNNFHSIWLIDEDSSNKKSSGALCFWKVPLQKVPLCFWNYARIIPKKGIRLVFTSESKCHFSEWMFQKRFVVLVLIPRTIFKPNYQASLCSFQLCTSSWDILTVTVLTIKSSWDIITVTVTYWRPSGHD